MHRGKTIVCVIPARLGSTRMQQKMLADLKGKPLIQQTYEAAKSVPMFDDVVVAVDCKELFDVVTSFGGKAALTDPNCANGTERLIELQSRDKFEADIWVNWQGDEPFITQEMMKILLQSCDEEDEKIWTLKKEITDVNQLASPDVVKVVCDKNGRALYFSRSTIPFHRSREIKQKIYKHVGLYAFTSNALTEIASLAPSPLEEAEKLEQLRFLYHGLPIQVHVTMEEVFGIDTKEELLLAQTL